MRYYYKKGNAYLSLKSPRGEGYTPITEEEFNSHNQRKAIEVDKNFIEIQKLKAQHDSTNDKALDFVDGLLSEEEYAPIKAERQALRAEINRLEAEINGV